MRRRDFIVSGGAATMAWPAAAYAQQPAVPVKRPLVGYLTTSSKPGTERYRGAYLHGMRELGYEQGRNFVFEDRYADGNANRLPKLAEELVRLKSDVILTSPTTAAIAMKRATSHIPIVGVLLTDPVGAGLVESEARPRTNVTGILSRVEGLPGKVLELALELVPGAGRIGILVNVQNPSNVIQRRELEAAAAKFGVILTAAEVQPGDDLHPVFAMFVRERVSIVVVLGDAFFFINSRRIAAYALASRLPTLLGNREHVEDGGLMSYAVSQREIFRRVAHYVDRILKGERPADLPVEFPTKVELVINLTTAKAIGLAVPPALLLRADEVIE